MSYLKGKNVLVTGGPGFIGSNLLLRLLDEDCASIRSVSRSNIPKIIHPNIQHVACDLCDRSACRAATTHIDCVFMCAANTSGADVMEKTPLVHVTPNVVMNTLMLEAAYKNNVDKFIFLSSTTAYPDKDIPLKETDLTREDLFEKYFCVGWMKIFSEIMCEMYATKIKKPMKCIVARVGNAYGEYDDFEWATSHVVPALIRRVVERHDPIEVWGDGYDIKDLVYIKDLVDGLVLIANKIDSFEHINLASGYSYTLRSVLKWILQIDGYSDAKVTYDASKPTMIKKRMIDISKARSLLDYNPKFDILIGLANTIKWYRNELKK